MGIKWSRLLTAFVVGVALGTPLGLALNAVLGHEMVALGAVNAAGWFGLGAVSGRWGEGLYGVRGLLAGIGVAGFSSLAPLVLRGPENTGAVLVAVMEVVFGFLLAVIGHLVTMPRGSDL